MALAPQLVAWGALAVVAALNAVGYLFGLWSEVSWYDNALHALTTFGVTLVVGVYLAPVIRLERFAAPLFVVLVASVGLALGALWEVGEWVFDQLFTSGSAIPGKTDTIIDLVLDAVGGLVAAALAWGLAESGPESGR